MVILKKKAGQANMLPGIKKVGLLALALIFVMVSTSYAQVTIPNSPRCKDLMAGKTIDAGNLCVEVTDDILYVTYTTTGGWELVETHLWVGLNRADLPRNRKGNPKVGHFPYHSGDITGKKICSFAIPLIDLGGPDYNQTLCDQKCFVAAHAKVRIENGNGGYRTQSAWAAGQRINKQGNWAMGFRFKFKCEIGPPPQECETAFTYGDKALRDIIGPGGNPITNEWGWQITVYPGDRVYLPIYEGATQNNPNNGTYVGDLYIGYSGTFIRVEYYTFSPYPMAETNLYIGTQETNTADPDQFGRKHILAKGDHTDVYVISISGSPVYVVAHAEVCETTQ